MNRTSSSSCSIRPIPKIAHNLFSVSLKQSIHLNADSKLQIYQSYAWKMNYFQCCCESRLALAYSILRNETKRNQAKLKDNAVYYLIFKDNFDNDFGVNVNR